MKTWASILAVISASVPFQALSQNLTGNEMLAICEDQNDAVKAGYCAGYVSGLVEGMRWGAAVPIMRLGGGKKPIDAVNAEASLFLGFCGPDGANWQQYQDIIVAYIRNNPKDRANSARFLSQLALIDAFPCK